MKCYQRNINTLLSAALLCVSGINSARAEANETTINKTVASINSFNCSADSSWFTHPSLPTQVYPPRLNKVMAPATVHFVIFINSLGNLLHT